MSSIIGLLDHQNAKSIPSIWKDKILPSALAFMIACTVIFSMGFTETSQVHNAAHDGRHSAGFPCH